MIIAVAFTEYQLIQIQALISKFSLKDVYLITFQNKRIPEWLIDKDLYTDILRLPENRIKRHKRIKKKYIDEKIVLINRFIAGRKVELLIGAQDENTVFAIIKLLAKSRKYWSIEDGLANYYHRKVTFKMGILLKKILFNLVYRYSLDLSYGHGKVRSDKSFRMLPALCVDEGEHVSYDSIINNYVISLCQKNNLLLNKYGKKYSDKEILVITHLKKYVPNSHINHKMLYKFHPSEEIGIDIHDEYIQDYIPIELLVGMMPNLKTVKFDSVSSSILNLLCLYKDIYIEIGFNYKGRNWSDFFNCLLNKYPERIKVTQF